MDKFNFIVAALNTEAEKVAGQAVIPRHNVEMFKEWYVRDQLIKMVGAPFYASRHYVNCAVQAEHFTGYGETRLNELVGRYSVLAIQHGIIV